ncbi:MAG: membrane protein insertase YidC [Pseudomonadota bacterium]|nr:membrane protein insertase YidC [Gammaproteobacteria bacterium]MBU1558241.1 membrane protein insertase YidC [Gammaproteobacteria bacterium]MBU1628625.1 membrane protein insertase YidC [Gammaproteobacteria bacterium]MBU1926248.1 membrane protein insertase YidC [Gammaproteobacteria bacterium]MBU2546663.1 membrane protein insertase YidC [Gammaproteobacteria bacterium]
MNKIRYFLYAALIIVGLALWNVWVLEHSPKTTNDAAVAYKTSQSTSSTASNPAELRLQSKKILTQKAQEVPEDRVVKVNTDVLSVWIDQLGGNIVKVALPKYPKEIKSDQPFVLLDNTPSNFYIAKNGIIPSNSETPYLLQFQTTQKTFALNKNQKQLVVTLKANGKSGLLVTKQFIFEPNKYDVQVQVNIKNASNRVWSGNYFMQINRTAPEEKGGFFRMHLTPDVAFSSPSKPYKKVSLSKLSDNPIHQNITGGWLAMLQHYFLSVWIPDSKSDYHYYSRVNANGIYTAGMIGPTLSLEPNATVDIHSKFYAGPKISDRLKTLAPHLSLAVDYSSFAILSLLANFIFWILKHINNIVGNWGWSIIIVTILIKLAFYHLSATSYRSMAGMRKLQPRITALKERYGEDKQGFSRAMMELYKKEKINPLSGCLPILIQIPVFLALYWVLLSSVELRQAPFIFWIHDLSAKDPYYILPVLMGISMFVQQKLSPAPADPTQAKVMMFLPVMFTVFFLNFPSGLVLYWLVNNVLSVAQQYYIMRRYEHVKNVKKKK